MNPRQKMPRLSRLRVFEVAAQHLSFTEASYELEVTQAAVSQQVRLLEQELGIVLFERLNRGLAITEEGRRLLRGVSDAFDTIEMATEDACLTGHGPELKIGATFAVATFWLIPRLEQFRSHYPDINVHLIATDRGFHDIADQLDVGIAFGKGVWTGLQSAHLCSPKVFPVCSPDYLAKSNSPTCAEELVEETLLSVDKHGMSSDGNWRNWLSQFKVNSSRIGECITFNSHPLLVQATCAGQGIALGWSLLTDDLITSGQLVRVINEETPAREDFYYVEKSNTKTYAQECFKKWLFELNWPPKI
jgi:LysR family transcriptional regulator, glycine cleavage system transcriptional activator